MSPRAWLSALLFSLALAAVLVSIFMAGYAVGLGQR